MQVPKKSISALAASGGNGAGDGVWITFQRETAHRSHRLLCSQLGVGFSVCRDMGITPASPDKALLGLEVCVCAGICHDPPKDGALKGLVPLHF